MVIDDDAVFGALLRTALEREGFHAIVHSEPVDALRELDVQPVDAVVVDKQMPRLGGMEVVARARDRHPDLPIVLITAFGGTRVGEEARARGANAYLEKPFFVRDLVLLLRTLARR
jgi:DNA-binding response OmpR family regulator